MGLRNFALALITVLISMLGQSIVKSSLNQTRAATVEGAGFVSTAILAVLNPLLWGGIAVMSIGVICYFTLLYFTDFTRALPVMGAIGYILIPLYGHFVLHESFSPFQWTGLAMLIGGIWLLSK